MFYMFQKYARAKYLSVTLRKSVKHGWVIEILLWNFNKLKKTLKNVDSSPYLWIMKHNKLSIMLGQTKQPFFADWPYTFYFFFFQRRAVHADRYFFL